MSEKTNPHELIGADLDAAVAMVSEAWKTAHEMFPTMTLDPTFKGVEIIDGRCTLIPNNPFRQDPQPYRPSTDWSQGGPIIEKERISIVACHDEWDAHPRGREVSCASSGPTPLIAAMRAFVALKSV